MQWRRNPRTERSKLEFFQTEHTQRRLKALQGDRKPVWRRLLPILLPLGLFICVCWAETVVLTAWRDNHQAGIPFPVASALLKFLSLFPLLGLLFLGAFLLTSRCRVFLFESNEKGLIFGYKRDQMVRWNNISRIVIAPLEKAGELAEVHFYMNDQGKCGSLRRRRSAILERMDQIPQLLVELRKRHAQHPVFTVRELDAPLSPMQPPTLTWRPFALMTIAMWLFLHGFPLLMVGMKFDAASPAERKSTFDPQRHQMVVYLAKHFHSVDDLRKTVRWVGGASTAAAAVLVFLGYRASSRESQQYDNEVQQHYDRADFAPGTTIASPSGETGSSEPIRERMDAQAHPSQLS